MKKKNRGVLKICVWIIEFASFFAGAFCFSADSFSAKTAELSILNNEVIRENADSLCGNITFEGGPKQKPHEGFFLNSYSANFTKTSTRLLAVSDDHGFASFDTYFNEDKTPFALSAVSGYTYSNSRTLVRMETVCLNLLLYREPSEELTYDKSKYDGFTYIPDYFADFLVESSASARGYLDLLGNDEIGYVALGKGDSYFKYRIANIFHVKGFNPQYAEGIKINYNDQNKGEQIDAFLGGFCFVSNYDRYYEIDPGLHTSIFYSTIPMKYELDETLSLARDYQVAIEAENATINLSLRSKIGNREYARSNRLSQAYFGSNKMPLWRVFLGLILYISAGALPLVGFFWFFIKSTRIRFSLISVAVATLPLFLSFALRKGFSNNIVIHSLFNPSLSAACCCYIALGCFLSFFFLIRSRKERA